MLDYLRSGKTEKVALQECAQLHDRGRTIGDIAYLHFRAGFLNTCVHGSLSGENKLSITHGAFDYHLCLDITEVWVCKLWLMNLPELLKNTRWINHANWYWVMFCAQYNADLYIGPQSLHTRCVEGLWSDLSRIARHWYYVATERKIKPYLSSSTHRLQEPW